MAFTDMMAAGTGAPMSHSGLSPTDINDDIYATFLLLFSIPVAALVPGLAYSIAPLKVNVSDGILHLYGKSSCKLG